MKRDASLAGAALHGVALYNPHLLSPDELIRLYVARQALLDRLTGELEHEDEGIPQSHLILGQRGMGKTMLLRRLALAIERDEDLSKRWIPLTFPEEQYDIASLSGFWLNCVDALSDAFERAGDEQAAESLDAQLDALPNGDEERRADAALTLLIDAARASGRRLVLLVDNVDLIFERVSKQQWDLRESLATSPEIVLIGASAQAVEATYKYDQSFYEFLRVHELGGLDLDETRGLLLHYADRLDAPHVRKVIENDPGRLQALHVLTAGNPRTLVLLFQLLDQGPDGDVRTDLEQMLDHSTPLYKARLEALPSQAQRVVHALAVHWYPATAKDVAEALDLKVNAVSTQLDRLAKQGVVQKESLSDTTRTGFRLSERFFNIWYLMRTSRRVRRKLVWLVEFLRIMYRPEELRQQARGRLGASAAHPERVVHHAEMSLVLAETLEASPLRSALEVAAVEQLMSADSSKEQLDHLIGLDASEPVRSRAETIRLLQEARAIVFAADFDGSDWDADTWWGFIGGSWRGSPQQKVEMARVVATGEGREAIFRSLQSERDEISRYVGVKPYDQVGLALARGYMRSSEDLDGADIAQVRLGLSGLKMIAAAVRLERGFDEEAAAALEHGIEETDPEGAFPWLSLGNLYKNHLSRYEESEAAYKRAVELDASYPYPWLSLGNLYQVHLSRYEESEAAYKQAIELDASFAFPWSGLGSLYQYHLSRYEESESAYMKAIELDASYAYPWNGLGILYAEGLSRYEDSEKAFKKAIILDASFVPSLTNLGRLYGSFMNRYKESEAAYKKVIELDRESGVGQNAIAWLYYEHGGDLEVAQRLARESVELRSRPAASHTLATILAHQGHWGDAEKHARDFLAGGEDFLDSTFDDIVLFFKEAITTGHAAEAGVLLDEVGLGERWLPLREAVETVARGDRGYLRSLPPEVRTPTEELLGRLVEADWQGDRIGRQTTGARRT